MFDLALLGVLREGPLHGYELKKRLRDFLGPWSSVSFGSLYPALARLEHQGAVRAVAVDDAGRTAPAAAPTMPFTGSITGEAAARARHLRPVRGLRGKKVYDITPSGQSRLAELLATAPDDDRSFPLKLALFRWCEAPARMSTLERRRATLVQRLHDARGHLASSGDRLDGYVRLLVEHEADSTERDIAWLDGLLAAEQGRTTVPATTTEYPEARAAQPPPSPSLSSSTTNPTRPPEGTP